MVKYEINLSMSEILLWHMIGVNYLF